MKSGQPQGGQSKLVALRKNGVLYYAGTDHLGSTVRLTDSLGAPVANSRQRYGVWGTERDSTAGMATDRRYTGQTEDLVSGLYWYRSRYYDANLGRFCQPDSIVPEVARPQSWNRYAYAANSPVTFNDPDGHWIFGPGLPDWWPFPLENDHPSGPPTTPTAGPTVTAVATPLEATATSTAVRATPTNTPTTVPATPTATVPPTPSGTPWPISTPGPRAYESGGSEEWEPGANPTQDELDAGEELARRGHQVVYRYLDPTARRDPSGRTSDVEVDGDRYDVYTPRTGNTRRIVERTVDKKDQAPGVVLDLRKTDPRVRQGDLTNDGRSLLDRIRGGGHTNIGKIIILE